MSANDTPTGFTDDNLAQIKRELNQRIENIAVWAPALQALIERLEVAEHAVDEASCLLDHPAFTVGTRSQELLPQGMAARAKSAKEAIDVWVKVTGKYQ